MDRIPNTPFDLTEGQRAMITLCLRLGAESFRANVAKLQEPPVMPAYAGLIDQFERQTVEAEALADRIDNAKSITVGADTPDEPEAEDEPRAGNLNTPAEQWLKEQFEYEYCPECGGDAEHHTAVPFMGNWFARCDYPAPDDADQHPVITEFRAKADEAEDEPEESEPEEDSDEPDEDAITTSDDRTFYQYGKKVLEIDEDDDRDEALVMYMNRAQFWPDCWTISDHGNSCRIDLQAAYNAVGTATEKPKPETEDEEGGEE